MKIWYHRNDYVSYFRSGQEYMDCLRSLGHELVNGPERADLAVLHDEPTNYPLLAAQMGARRPKRVAGYAVWEMDKCPAAFAPGLRLVDEVWTCSEFSRAALAPACSAIFTLPHVVLRLPLAEREVGAARERFAARPGDFVFFSVVDFLNPRKNVETLLAAYALVRQKLGERVRLAVKQYRAAARLPAVPGLVAINDGLSDREMAALAAACDCYVSAHHCEAWGLSISEAMAYGKPVIATGYSGNMEYMSAENSIPVPYAMAPVSAAMRERLPICDADMRWADVSLPDLARAMIREALGRGDKRARAKASAIAETFGPEAVARILDGILRRNGGKLEG